MKNLIKISIYGGKKLITEFLTKDWKEKQYTILKQSKWHWFGHCEDRSLYSPSEWRRNEFESGDTHPARSAGIFCPTPPLFWLFGTISHFGERFCDGQYSWFCFFFAVLIFTVPRARHL